MTGHVAMCSQRLADLDAVRSIDSVKVVTVPIYECMTRFTVGVTRVFNFQIVDIGSVVL